MQSYAIKLKNALLTLSFYIFLHIREFNKQVQNYEMSL